MQLRQLGHEVLMIVALNATESPPAPDAIAYITREIGPVIFVITARGLLNKMKKVFLLPWRPLMTVDVEVRTRMAVLDEVVAFDPHVLWLDYLFMFDFVKALAEALLLPIAMRSHNLEFRYRRALAHATKRQPAKFMAWLRSLSVQRLEHRASRAVVAIYDISASDVDYWRRHTCASVVRWLPPVFTFERNGIYPKPSYHAAYIGSLSTAPNVEGLVWFFKLVHPIVVSRHPGFRVIIGGSSPTPALISMVAAIPGVELQSNVSDPNTIWAAGEVLINPVLSGEGINIKAVEMLGFDRPLVTTAVGTRGLPDEVRSAFRVGDSPEAFAEAICESLGGEPQDHHVARSYFGQEHFANMFAELESLAPGAKHCIYKATI
jgi:hypothetical protein